MWKQTRVLKEEGAPALILSSSFGSSHWDFGAESLSERGCGFVMGTPVFALDFANPEWSVWLCVLNCRVHFALDFSQREIRLKYQYLWIPYPQHRLDSSQLCLFFVYRAFEQVRGSLELVNTEDPFWIWSLSILSSDIFLRVQPVAGGKSVSSVNEQKLENLTPNTLKMFWYWYPCTLVYLWYLEASLCACECFHTPHTREYKKIFCFGQIFCSFFHSFLCISAPRN